MFNKTMHAYTEIYDTTQLGHADLRDHFENERQIVMTVIKYKYVALIKTYTI